MPLLITAFSTAPAARRRQRRHIRSFPVHKVGGHTHTHVPKSDKHEVHKSGQKRGQKRDADFRDINVFSASDPPVPLSIPKRPPPPPQGAQPRPSHCPTDAKCQPQRHLWLTVTAPIRFGDLLQPPV